MNIKGFKKDNLIPLNKIINIKDKNKHKNYQIYFTLDDFKRRFPSINIDYVYYCENNLYGNMIYYDKNKYIYFSIPIYGDKYLNCNKKESDDENLLNRIKFLENLFIEKKYSILLSLINNDYMKIRFVDSMINGNIVNDFKTFSDIYTSVDYGFSNISKKTIVKVKNFRTYEQYEDMLNLLKYYPEKIRIYRGEGTFSNDYTNAYSWSTNINIANFFATRFTTIESKVPRIITGLINKCDLISYYDDRNESEIVITPDDIEIEDINYLYNIQDKKIENVCSEILDIYYHFKSILNDLNFEYDTDGHGRIHSLRVLFLALIIGKLEALDYGDMITLATACIYHDIGRTDEEEGSQHGIESYKIYESSIIKNEKIKLIIEGHCEDDNIALKKIKESSINNKENTIKMLKILKDADALDRVRFGVRGLDFNYLRLEPSRKMTFLAQEVLENLKL